MPRLKKIDTDRTSTEGTTKDTMLGFTTTKDLPPAIVTEKVRKNPDGTIKSIDHHHKAGAPRFYFEGRELMKIYKSGKGVKRIHVKTYKNTPTDKRERTTLKKRGIPTLDRGE